LLPQAAKLTPISNKRRPVNPTFLDPFTTDNEQLKFATSGPSEIIELNKYPYR
jgi:hypothetical protein